jgi:hypothetical protein
MPSRNVCLVLPMKFLKQMTDFWEILYELYAIRDRINLVIFHSYNQ